MAGFSRRAFLKVAGAAGLALATGCKASPPQSATQVSGSTVDPTAIAVDRPPRELIITPTGELYVQSYARVPSVDAQAWTLNVHGLVDHETTLGLEDIRAFPKIESMRTLECIGNPVGGPLIGNVVWGGTEARALWERVGIQSQARRARFSAEDEYSTSVDLEWITQPGVLLVYEMNGEPLPPEHGFPLRILMPGLYGQKMPKWIREIEFIDEDHLGYWESRGWSDVASVKTNSIIQQPLSLERVSAGSLPIFGVAFAGLRAITRVEVRIDDGDWTGAELLQDPSSLVWTQWSIDWPANAGSHRIAVRATDEEGFVQSTEGESILSSSFPDGTDHIHSLVVTVV
ncbi:MAG TPA: molybdopterin-dependent oxidoreductase [Anaerolineales bacterium]|nr:molybdopterin-dependent oxidoreductase [Anaerolineales bacterium]